jgi:hypothetical protein
VEHKLNALIRLDLDPTSAVVEITGCLTLGGSQALLPVIRRLANLVPGAHRSVTVSLLAAKHIDAEGLAYLHGLRSMRSESLAGKPLTLRLQAPEVLPECPAHSYASVGPDASAARGADL